MTFHEGAAKLEFNKKEVASYWVDNEAVTIAGVKIDYATDQEIECLCGEKQKVGPFKK